MWTLGPLSFLAPWALAALLALPALWWLLRITPPNPLRMVFPAATPAARIEGARGNGRQVAPVANPLRVALALAVILGLSDPVLNAARGLAARGRSPDRRRRWAAARDWPGRQARWPICWTKRPARVPRAVDRHRANRGAVPIFK
jgi:hypothetical protein